MVFTEDPWVEPGPAGGGRPRTRQPQAGASRTTTPRPASLKELAARTAPRKVTWREGTKGKLTGRFSWPRAWPGTGLGHRRVAAAEPIWLLIEEQADARGDEIRPVSNLPERTPAGSSGGAAVEEPLAGGAKAISR